jgi:hypothetical protein
MIPTASDTNTVSPLEQWLQLYQMRYVLSDEERRFVEDMVNHYYQQRVELPASFRDPYNASRKDIRTPTSIEALYPEFQTASLQATPMLTVGNEQHPITAASVQANNGGGSVNGGNYMKNALAEQSISCTITIGDKK